MHVAFSFHVQLVEACFVDICGIVDYHCLFINIISLQEYII